MCFSSVLYVPIAVTKLELMHFCRVITVFMHLQVCWFLVFQIFYSLLPTVRVWKLMGVSNRPTFVSFKVMRNFCSDAWCDDQNTHGMFRCSNCPLRNHKISKLHHVATVLRRNYLPTFQYRLFNSTALPLLLVEEKCWACESGWLIIFSSWCVWCIWGQLLPLGATASLSPWCELSQREQVHARYTPSTSSNLPLALSVSPSFFHNDSHSGFSSVMQSHATSVYTRYVHAYMFIAFQKVRERGGKLEASSSQEPCSAMLSFLLNDVRVSLFLGFARIWLFISLVLLISDWKGC